MNGKRYNKIDLYFIDNKENNLIKYLYGKT